MLIEFYRSILVQSDLKLVSIILKIENILSRFL